MRDSFEAETHQVLRNLRAQVEAAGSSMDKVLKTTVFLEDMDNFARLNEIYVQYFRSRARPAAPSTPRRRRLPGRVEAIVGF